METETRSTDTTLKTKDFREAATDGIGDGRGGAERPCPAATNVVIGGTAPIREVIDIDRRDFVQYTDTSGDLTLIRSGELFATGTGHETIFAQGILTAGYAAHAVTDWISLATITRFRVMFKAKLFPGEDIGHDRDQQVYFELS